MTPKHVRFARAIAFAAAATGCGARTTSLDELVAASDDAATGDGGSGDAHTDARSDARTDAETDAPALPGTCETYGTFRIDCGVGRTCTWDTLDGTVACTGHDPSAAPCGAISCGASCTCADAREGVCRCNGPVEGPLPPPDLAAA